MKKNICIENSDIIQELGSFRRKDMLLLALTNEWVHLRYNFDSLKYLSTGGTYIALGLAFLSFMLLLVSLGVNIIAGTDKSKIFLSLVEDASFLLYLSGALLIIIVGLYIIIFKQLWDQKDICIKLNNIKNAIDYLSEKEKHK